MALKLAFCLYKRYIIRFTETSKKIIYSGDRTNYYKWADAMFNRGFDCSIETVMDILNVSLSWVKHTLLKEIPYVTYSYKYLYQKGIKSRVTTYIDMQDLIQWIMQVSQFRRQTELVDLYSYLSLANKKKADIALKMYKNIIKTSNIGYNPGIIPDTVLLYINKEYLTNFEPKNLSCVKRKEVPWADVEPFDIFERDYYFPDVTTTAELVYRDAFMRGDIKVSIGNKKTIFVKSNTDISRMAMPFLIPYNKKIIIQDRN